MSSPRTVFLFSGTVVKYSQGSKSYKANDKFDKSCFYRVLISDFSITGLNACPTFAYIKMKYYDIYLKLRQKFDFI